MQFDVGFRSPCLAFPLPKVCILLWAFDGHIAAAAVKLHIVRAGCLFLGRFRSERNNGEVAKTTATKPPNRIFNVC
ncbi:hypothetical protein HRbin36_02252 [bacterium HR36]|nr:hypothetical protein HRbin36_02252 [bacterium HR36]